MPIAAGLRVVCPLRVYGLYAFSLYFSLSFSSRHLWLQKSCQAFCDAFDGFLKNSLLQTGHMNFIFFFQRILFVLLLCGYPFSLSHQALLHFGHILTSFFLATHLCLQRKHFNLMILIFIIYKYTYKEDKSQALLISITSSLIIFIPPCKFLLFLSTSPKNTFQSCQFFQTVYFFSQVN